MDLTAWRLTTFLAVLGMGLLGAPLRVLGEAPSLAGMITEIRVGRGRVEVKPGGTEQWNQAGPLMALQAGDAVRATEDAWVVIALSSRPGSVKVDAASSPFVIPPPRGGESRVERVLALLRASLVSLLRDDQEARQATLITRAGPRPPVILSPRNGPVLPESLVFEWMGSRFRRYDVTILGPAGPILQRTGVPGARLEYPRNAPTLAPGTRYTIRIDATGRPPQEAWFEVLDPDRALAVRRAVGELDGAIGAAVPSNTRTLLRAGLLVDKGLIHEARLVVLAALSDDPDEAALHELLGNLYSRTGLPDLAAEAYNEARFLATPRKGQAGQMRR